MSVIDISDEVAALCAKLGVDADYVLELEVAPTLVTVQAICGTEGLFAGRKMLDHAGDLVTVELRYRVTV